jgi:uncharacterized protein YeaO (DUF488 family)
MSEPKLQIHTKRVYEPASRADGTRLLADRLWPRGVTKAAAKIDEWLKDIAPSPELRKWFGHDPAKWEEFQRRYRAELGAHEVELARLRQLARQGRVTLVYAARDDKHNSASVLRDVLLAGQ